jgi:undecaprenyl-diphosphatase
MHKIPDSPALASHRVVECVSAWALAVAALSGASFSTVRYEPVLATHFDWPVLLKLNQFVFASAYLNRAISGVSALPLLTGILLIGLLWYFWFSLSSETARVKLLLGLCAAVVAVMISRGLQLILPTHLRPIHSLEHGFHIPPGLDPSDLNGWNSFPSDHACLYFALVAVIWLQSWKVGLFAVLPALLGTLPRIFLGIHYPTDVAFGALLGIFIVMLVENYGPEKFARRILDLKRRKRNIFYFCGFLLTYQVGTLFEDIRELAAGLAKACGLIIS